MPWLPFDIALDSQTQQSHVVIRIPGTKVGDPNSAVDVKAETGSYDADTETYTFAKGVIAQYGPTTLTAESLIIKVGAVRQLQADGNVVLHDPLAELHASNLIVSIDADGSHGHTENASVRVGRATIKAKSIDVMPDMWVLTDASGTSCWETPKLYELSARKLIVYPGKEAIATSSTLSLFGRKVVTLPERKFNLDPEQPSTNLPLIGYRKDAGFGLDWNNGFLLKKSSSLNVDLSAYQSLRPSVVALYTHSLLPSDANLPVLTPQSDLQRRFRYAYMESADNRSPDSELTFLRRKRHAISFGASINENSVTSINNVPVTKLGDFAYEQGGPIGKGGYILTTRIQFARELNEALKTRGVIRGTYSPGNLLFGKGLRLMPRLEYGGFVGGNSYSWLMANMGLVWSPNKNLNLGLNGFTSQEAGSPLFESDRLIAKHGFDTRMDLKFGGTKISLLEKWDRDKHWLDPEFSISQVAGCIEPFVIYHRLSRDLRIGIQLRMDDVYNLFRERNSKEVVISSPDKP